MAESIGEGESHDFPADQVETLHERRSFLLTTTLGGASARHDALLPAPLPVLPQTCGLVRHVTILGIFPTSRWLTDPTMPRDVQELFGGTPFWGLGAYRVAQATLLNQKVTIVLHPGVPGWKTAAWGGAFVGDSSCIARFVPVHRYRTKVVVQESGSEMAQELDEFYRRFHVHLEFSQASIHEQEQVLDDESSMDSEYSGHEDKKIETDIPACRESQSKLIQFQASKPLEQILAILLEYLMWEDGYSDDWHSLPQSLQEHTDRSPRGERKHARRILSSRSKKYRQFFVDE